MMNEVLSENIYLAQNPIYVFGQSYGGKYGPAFGVSILEARLNIRLYYLSTIVLKHKG